MTEGNRKGDGKGGEVNGMARHGDKGRKRENNDDKERKPKGLIRENGG